jgi:hypothetical protein
MEKLLMLWMGDEIQKKCAAWPNGDSSPKVRSIFEDIEVNLNDRGAKFYASTGCFHTNLDL